MGEVRLCSQSEKSIWHKIKINYKLFKDPAVWRDFVFFICQALVGMASSVASHTFTVESYELFSCGLRA